VKWRNIETTLSSGQRDDLSVMRAKPPQHSISQVSEDSGEERSGVEVERDSDGLDFLDGPPPDLTGIDGTSFTIGDPVDLHSPDLLDVLSDKPLVRASTREVGTKSSVQVPLEGVRVAPTASEWDAW
jgi:hypothetical protein